MHADDGHGVPAAPGGSARATTSAALSEDGARADKQDDGDKQGGWKAQWIKDGNVTNASPLV
jgi:hypothetical protein